ncbi:MAG: FeS assembly protein SufD [Candidatus Magasanikbacteria bacterium GW2011_GWA2_56_11]|uniref:FeS assembly protein SufD n=1 Tax=Candidatus Magasanikbacteria bacterium GW2011_GWA2_56_11 TaxID=1619044 RepID=A0A0G2BAL2_9BACT|nr:MAG: FeS assembly protein SufD [Candidatus Magasanikbacteria bacterium GW2011_GWA2_56_11]
MKPKKNTLRADGANAGLPGAKRSAPPLVADLFSVSSTNCELKPLPEVSTVAAAAARPGMAGLEAQPMFSQRLAPPIAAYALRITRETLPAIDLDIRQVKAGGLIYLEITAETGSTANIWEKITAAGWAAVIVNLRLESQCRITYAASQTAAPEAGSWALRQANVAAGAEMTWFDLALQGSLTASEITTYLTGERARGAIYGIFSGSGDEVRHLNHRVEHLASRTESNLLTRGVLGGRSRADYRSLIRIAPDAPGCRGQEREDTLLLSPQARIESLPELEIRHHDVACSHAVTATRLDPERLFYLQSRGLDASAARELLVRGHIFAILDALPRPGLRRSVSEFFLSRSH